MPIHWAASGGHTNIVEYLVSFDVPIDVRDDVSTRVQVIFLLL